MAIIPHKPLRQAFLAKKSHFLQLMTIFERPLRYHMQNFENRRINVNFLYDSCNFTVIMRYFPPKAHENGKKKNPCENLK